MQTSLKGRLVTPDGVLGGRLIFGETIEGLEPGPGTGPYILPGFIDSHVHGGGGGDTMDGAEGVRTLASFHLEHGSTTLYPTTMTNPWENMLSALRGVQQVRQAADPSLPDIPGAHLEGPFISPARLGAQPPFTLEPTAERVAEVLEYEVVKLVTLAPEIPSATEAATTFAKAGVRVSIGHTNSSYDEARELIDTVRVAGGVAGFTHLFNAMTGLASRAPGVVGTALADNESYAELIFDKHHVHPGSFLAALNAKAEHLQLITDAIRACGLAEGNTELGGQAVTVKNGAARLADGTLAGSVLTLDSALRNAVAAGVSLARASRLLSANPARYLGLADRGELSIGKRADLVVLGNNLEVLEVYVAGRRLFSHQ